MLVPMSMLTPTTIIDIRHGLGISQERMAQMLGVSYVSVNRWENGHSAVTGAVADLYRAFAAALARGHAAAKILASASGDRGQFLFLLYAMAFGPEGAP